MSPDEFGDEAQRRFEQVSGRFLAERDVTQGTGFGTAPGLRASGKIFAMLVNGELVVKLPKDRVEGLVAAGAGAQFDPGHGRLMKEWASVPAESPEDWDGLVEQAFRFVVGVGR
jgi:hypothetical protein